MKRGKPRPDGRGPGDERVFRIKEVTGAEVSAHVPADAAHLFGWHTQTVEGGYVLIDTHSGSGMNGGLGTPSDGGEPSSIFYAQGPDIQALLFECTGFPLVAAEVRRLTKLPVYDITTLCKLTLASVM